MKKALSVAIFVAMSVWCFSQSKNAAGTWLGTLDVGVKLRLVFHINNEPIALYSATMESPDQGAKGIPVSLVTLAGDSLHVEVNVIKGIFYGKFTNDTTVTGTWSQGPFKAPLTIVKTNEIIALNRPQTPKPPFNYTSEDVEYFNADKSVHFGATFTYPASGGPFPTAILITGSGQQDRDETIFEHKPFAVIADYLTKKGYAILRVDDRGVGKTNGDVMNATSADFAKDVEAGLAFLKSRLQTDRKRVGLIGHSEGGLIAALVAAKRKDIDFMVLLAGPGTKGSELLAGQGAAILKSTGIPSATVSLYMSFYTTILNIAASEKDTATAFKKTWAVFENWKKQANETERKQLGFTGDSTSAVLLHTLVNSVSLPWTKYFLKTDPANLLKMTNAKVLALNGEKDLQVIAESNLKGIIVALQKRKSQVHDVKMLPGLNHLFQKCVRCTIDEYAGLEQTIAPEALETMGEWLEKNVKK